MSDDPAGVVAVVCVTACVELFGGLCLDFASITHTCTSRLCPWPFDSKTNDQVEDVDPGERDLLIPKPRAQGEITEAPIRQSQPSPFPTMSQPPPVQ